MKKVFLVLPFILLLGCVAKKETFLIIVSEDKVYVAPKTRKDTTYLNRFERQFCQADSVFITKLREASRQAAKEASEQINKKYKP